jgi:hypothetical protein
VSDAYGGKVPYVRPVGGQWHRGSGGQSDGPVSGTGRSEGHGRRAVQLQVKIASAANAARDRCSSAPFHWPSLVVVFVVGSVRRVVAGRRFECGPGTRNTSSAKRSFVETWRARSSFAAELKPNAC